MHHYSGLSTLLEQPAHSAVVLGRVIARGRWFMTHSLVNWVIVWFCVPDFTETMREPARAMALDKPFCAHDCRQRFVLRVNDSAQARKRER